MAENYQVPYFTVTPTFSVCARHGYLKGEQFSCPNCGEETEVYTRIVGYYRPVQNWNLGKKSEFKERTAFASSKEAGTNDPVTDSPEGVACETA
jgi:ribonucleoside-triphosphate reductase